MVGFIFDASKGETPAKLKRQREIAELLARGAVGKTPKDVGEGMNAVANAIMYRAANSRADATEKAGMDSANTAWGGIANLFGGGAEAAGGTPASSSTSSGTGMKGDEIAWKDAAPEQRAFLNTLAGPESGGRYNVIYGGGKFDSFADHPRQDVRIQTGPNAGRTSSAAGKYQFLGDTWDAEKNALGLPDFSPENQDKAAWHLAETTYKQQTGNDLGTVLKSGDPKAIAAIGPALRGQWTSLPGGIEQGTNQDKFVSTYQKYLAQGASPDQAQQAAAQDAGTQVASLDPAAGMPPEGAPAQAPAAPNPALIKALAAQGIPADSPQAQAFASIGAGGGEPQQPQPAGIPMPPSPVAQPQAPVQVAQATELGGGQGAGAFPAAPPDPNSGPGRIAALLAASQNQWMPEGQQAIVKALIGEEMKKADPAYKLQLEKAQLELDAMRNPKMSPSEQANYDLSVKKYGSEEAARAAIQSDVQADNTRADKAYQLDVSKFDYQKDKEALPEFYDAYVKQEKAAGREPLGILDFITTSKKAGAQNITVGGTTIEGEKKYDQTVGAGYGKRFVDMQDQAQAAQRTLNSLDVMQQAMSDPGFYSGTGAGAVQSLKRFGASMGMDPNGIDSIETFSALAKQAALDSMGGSLGTGFSNADRDFVTGQVPSLDNSPQGNTKLIDITRKLNVRKQQIAEQAREYAAGHNGRIDGGFDDHLAKWADANPLFPKPGVPQAGDTRTFNGVTYKFNGGDPADPQSWTK